MAFARQFQHPPDLAQVFTPERRTGRPRLVEVYPEFFAEPLTTTAGYWLGFIYADGSVAWKPSWTLTINLKLDDAMHLRGLVSNLGGRLVKKHKLVRYNAFSKKLCERLAWFGIIPRKSYGPVRPPNLEGAVQRAFLRGLFDGDGCLHVSKRGHLQAAFCGHPAVVEWFVATVGVVGSQRFRGNTLYYQWTGGRQARKIVRALYNGPGPALERKAEIARRYI